MTPTWAAILSAAAAVTVAILAIYRDTRPKPTNPQLDKAVAEHAVTLNEHGRRISAVELTQVECQRQQLAENDKLYNRLNATAEQLAKLTGRIEQALGDSRHAG